MFEHLGPTWLYSPVRRIIQTICLILFLFLFFYVCWPYGSPEYARTRAAKEFIGAEFFLILDPLLSISTALASKMWIWSLPLAGIMLLICVIFPRAFCGYICPFGTFIDLFDWAIVRRLARSDIGKGWWAHLKYYILSGILLAAIFGVLLSFFFAAIPVFTRGMLFLLSPLQIGLLKKWHRIPPINIWQLISLAMFFIILFLGFLKLRFWCLYVCPTGAIFSIGNSLRLAERRVKPTCINCGKCVQACPYDAIKSDFSTNAANCAFCQTCGGACPTKSIQFVSRWNSLEQKSKSAEKIDGHSLSRRGFVASSLSAFAVAAGVRTVLGSNSGSSLALVRPPGSVPESKFLQMCIRCGECIKACPNNVLQPSGFEQRLEGMWTPKVNADWAGCDPTCNNCGQVCPTGAIRALELEEKRAARMGLAILNKQTCLPHAGLQACQICVDECLIAGYHAIEFIRVGSEIDAKGRPVEDSGYIAPSVLSDKCVGCGLCQARCYAINVKEKNLLSESAIKVVAGAGREDRIAKGSYIKLRDEERLRQQEKLLKQKGVSDDYLPDFLK